MKLFKKRKKNEKSTSVNHKQSPTTIKQHKSGLPKLRKVDLNALGSMSTHTPEITIPDANPPTPVGIGNATMRECPNCGNKTLNLEGLCTSCGWQELGVGNATMRECPSCGNKTLNLEGVCSSCGWHEVGPADPIP